MVPAVPAVALRESMRCGSRWRGQPRVRGSTGQGRARAGLWAGSQIPRNGEERGEGAVPQGSTGPREACQGAAAAAAPWGTTRPLAAAVLLPPPACLSRQLLTSPVPKAGPGSQAGRELLGSSTLQLAPRPSQQLSEKDALLCMS